MELEPRVYLILAPAYLSKSDDVNTISTGALKTHSGCTSATHEALSHMQLTAKCGKSYKFMADSVFGLDYIKVKLHHFKSPMLKTKQQRNPFLAVKPYKLVHSKGSAVVHSPDITANARGEIIKSSSRSPIEDVRIGESSDRRHKLVRNMRTWTKTADSPTAEDPGEQQLSGVRPSSTQRDAAQSTNRINGHDPIDNRQSSRATSESMAYHHRPSSERTRVAEQAVPQVLQPTRVSARIRARRERLKNINAVLQQQHGETPVVSSIQVESDTIQKRRQQLQRIRAAIQQQKGKTPVENSIESETNAIHERRRRLHEIQATLQQYQDQQPTVKTVAVTAKDPATAMQLHLRFGHLNHEYIAKTIQKGNVKGLPQKPVPLKYHCPLCTITSAQKLPHGPLKDTTELRKGARFQADFIIFNVESIRGFKSALIITETKTRRKWIFVTRSRNAPIQQFRYFINHMRLKGYTCDELRVDEDGALCQNTNFMELVTNELHMTVQSTGGYNSIANGMVENPIKTVKRLVRQFLVGAGLPDTIWCYAAVYAIHIMNHRYHRGIDDIPIILWHDSNYEFNVKDLFIFGSKVYIIRETQMKKQLQVRTEKDPRDYMGLTIEPDELPPEGFPEWDREDLDAYAGFVRLES